MNPERSMGAPKLPKHDDVMEDIKSQVVKLSHMDAGPTADVPLPLTERVIPLTEESGVIELKNPKPKLTAVEKLQKLHEEAEAIRQQQLNTPDEPFKDKG